MANEAAARVDPPSVALATAIGLVIAARRICVLTGAGISTDSGIPDYRGPDGVWTRDPSAQRFVDFDAYRLDPQLRVQAWQRRSVHPAFAAEPNAGHYALAELHRRGRLPVLLTQNIDGLHQRAGVPDEDVVEVHGTVHKTHCLTCGDRRPMGEAIARVRAGEPDPACTRCGGILKSATIFFGQPLDQHDFERAVHATASSDLFIAIGTSLTVHPVAGLAASAVRGGGALVIVNAQPTPYDEQAAAVVREPIGAALPALVAA
jgi:NAD-dependent deacetylase